jgi:ribonucleotide monophosphatase NagD (HAD superfamily)
MVCANPDLVVMRGGERELCAGAVARRYEELDGEVRYHGKPYRPIYDTCFALLGDPDPARVLAVGDSLRTDIAGANAVGIDSVLITGGIHGDELNVRMGEMPDAAALDALYKRAGERPTAAMPAFRW